MSLQLGTRLFRLSRVALPRPVRRLFSCLLPRLWRCCLWGMIIVPYIVSGAKAGPPYVTDDPEPVEYHHWEVYIASAGLRTSDGKSGTVPHLEVNSGPAPDLQLHLVLPYAYTSGAGSGTAYGLGDTELGAKYRFLHETRSRPMAGVFPLLELPTGSAGRGLGSGHLQVFLPVWLQKSRGPWMTYGGGGYWINPGGGNRNYWLFGWLLQKDLNTHWTLGNEFYYNTSPAEGVSSQLNFNSGGQYNIDEDHHILFSAGRSIRGDTRLQTYVAYQWTFGERDGKGEAATQDIVPHNAVPRSAAPHGDSLGAGG